MELTQVVAALYREGGAAVGGNPRNATIFALFISHSCMLHICDQLLRNDYPDVDDSVWKCIDGADVCVFDC